jgi:hypothetical protein
VPAGVTINLGDLPSWVRAIGSIGAILAAIFLWRFDRSATRKDADAQQTEALRRMVAALRAELAIAVETAMINYESAVQFLARLDKAKEPGPTHQGRRRLPRRSVCDD